MFFKCENGDLMVGNYVESSEFILRESDKDTYEYPVEGWHWFATETEARTFFGIVAPE